MSDKIFFRHILITDEIVGWAFVDGKSLEIIFFELSKIQASASCAALF